MEVTHEAKNAAAMTNVPKRKRTLFFTKNLRFVAFAT
jgi:hypothetical protein